MNGSAVLWLGMQEIFGTASRRLHEAKERFGTPGRLFGLSAGEVREDEWLTESEKKALLSPGWDKMEKTIDAARAFGAHIITPDSEFYPDRLREIYSMPLVLYALGDPALLCGDYLIAMVGTRDPDEYGLACAKKLSGEAAALGGIVVSGLTASTLPATAPRWRREEKR